MSNPNPTPRPNPNPKPSPRAKAKAPTRSSAGGRPRTPDIIFSNSDSADARSGTGVSSHSLSEPERGLATRSASEPESDGDDDELPPGSPVIDIGVSATDFGPRKPGGILVASLLESWVQRTFPNASPADWNFLYGRFSSEIATMGIDLGNTLSDTYDDSRKHYLAAAAQLGTQLLQSKAAVAKLEAAENSVAENSLVIPDAPPSRLAPSPLRPSPSLTATAEPAVGLLTTLLADASHPRRSTLREEYLEQSCIGRGSFSVVTRVVHKLDRSVYALKQLPLHPRSLRRTGGGDASLGWRRVLWLGTPVPGGVGHSGKNNNFLIRIFQKIPN